MFGLLRLSSAILALGMLFVSQNTNAASRAGVAPTPGKEFVVPEKTIEQLRKDYFTLCSLYTDMKKQFNDLQSQVDGLSHLHETVSNFNDRVDELEGQGLSNLGHRVDMLEISSGKHCDNIQATSARCTRIESSVFDLEQRLKCSQSRARENQMSYTNYFNRGHVVSAIAGAAAFGAATYMSARLPSFSFGGIKNWVSARFNK